jgi:peptide/nickel transport system permease protein
MDITVEQISTSSSRGFFADVLSRLFRKKPLGAVGAVIFLLLLVTGIFAHFIAPYSYTQTNPSVTLQSFSAKHLLGTDNLGRDVLSRIIYGARNSLIISSSATILSIIISVFIGLTSGFFGGKYDMILQRFVDAWMIFPGLIVLLVAVSVVGPGMLQIIIILGLSFGIGGSRIVRGATVSIKENVYVQAANSIGTSNTRILLRYILPNIMAPIIIMFTNRLAEVLLTEATLSFLGLGVPPPAPTWGGMLSGEGRDYMFMAPRLAFIPGFALSLVVYGINVFGDALRDLLDPRLR